MVNSGMRKTNLQHTGIVQALKSHLFFDDIAVPTSLEPSINGAQALLSGSMSYSEVGW